MVSVNTQLNTAGTPLIVAEGGTGVNTMTTAYAPICAGTTATGALQVASTGLSSSGFVLTSNGSSAVPSFQAIPGGLTTTSTSLTVSQITGASTTPVQLVAAQGANTIICVVGLVFKMVVGSTAYTLNSNSIIFGLNSTHTGISLACTVQPISGAAFTGNTSQTMYFYCGPAGGSVVNTTFTPIITSGVPTNTALSFSSTSSITGGTGSGNSTVDVTYFVMNV